MNDLLADDHIHAALIVDGGVLVAVVERIDIRADTHRLMLATQRRRLAVVNNNGAMLGLLRLKWQRLGFCTDADVQERASERVTRAGKCSA
jgi:hypothetical protein